MKTKKLISLCLTIALLASLLCLPAAAAEISDWDALSAALAKGGAVKLSADVTAPAERECILEVPEGVTASLDLNGFTLDGGTPGEEDCVILVHGSFTLTDSSAAGAGRITGTRDAVDVLGGEFTLAGGTLDGCGNDGVAVAEGGKLTMTGGAVRGSGQIGVYVTGEGSEATVSGGEISGSVGYYEDDWFYHGTGLQTEYGAVAEITGGVISGNVFGAKSVEATLTFSGGEVRDNYEVPLGDEGDTYGGAGLYAYQGRLFMTGGTVSGNTFTGLYSDVGSETEVSGGTVIGDGNFAVQILDGEVALTGGLITGGTEAAVRVPNGSLRISGGEISGSPKSGVWVTGGSVSMTDGSIADNEWFGVQLASGSFELSGGALSGNSYSGVLLETADADFRMTGGTISGSVGYSSEEENWYWFGSGIEVFDGSTVMEGGEIFDCIDGIEVLGGSATLSGGMIRDSKIVDLDLDTESGPMVTGGVGASISAGAFTMTGGTISGCETHGVLVDLDGSAVISGGEINGSGWSALRMDSDGTLALEGSPVFADNPYGLCLLPGRRLTVGGPLALASPLSILSVELLETGGTGAPVTVGLPGNGSLDEFISDDFAYEITLGNDGEAVFSYIRCFPDVTGGEWYARAASFAHYFGIYEGTDKGFEPQLPMTNAMAVQALWNHAGKPDSDAELPWGDTAADAWYADALRWAVESGVADADAAAFEPNAPITRERFALLCYRYMQTLGKGFQGLWSFRLDFPDAGAVSEEAMEAVSWCVMKEIIIGMGNGTLNPQGVLTRAQTATILWRLFNLPE